MTACLRAGSLVLRGAAPVDKGNLGSRPQALARVGRAPPNWKQASLDASCRLPGSPDGLWRREDGKKLAQSVCGGRVYPDQKLG